MFVVNSSYERTAWNEKSFKIIKVILFVWHSLTVEQKAIFIGFSNEKCCFVMSRNNNKFAYIYIMVWQIWTETFSSDALQDSRLQVWQRFIAYNLKKGNEMECKFIICQITYYSVCTEGVCLLFVPTKFMSVFCLSQHRLCLSTVRPTPKHEIYFLFCNL
jgi:hypothetical protein